MKKIIFIFSLVLMLAMSSVVAFAQDAQAGITISIDSTKIEFNDQTGSPFIDANFRTQVPFRVALEKFGAEVDWNNETRMAVATKGDIKVEVPIGENYILKNGEKVITDTSAIIENGKTYLPIRAVIIAFGSDVQWDAALKTVVITTTPVDANAILMDSYTKSAKWQNYDSKIVMDMSMPIPDESGNIQSMAMKMNMDMTAFTKPQKIKLTSSMIMDLGDEKMNQPVMDMYITIDKNKFTTYTGMYDQSSELTWTKSTVEDELLSQLSNYDVQANLELTKKYTKDVIYLGKNTDESGKTLLKIQSTLSGDVYTELLGSYLKQLAGSANAQDTLTADMLSNLGDLQFVLYIDEKSGEIVRYEMDLGSIFSSMFSKMTVSESMPQEALDMLKNIKATMIMNILNIDKAVDFKIPQEALNAPEALETSEETKNEVVE